MRIRFAAACLAATGLTLAACSSGSGAKAGAAPTTTATSDATAATVSTPVPRPAPSGYPIGQAYRWGDAGSSDTGTTTVLAYTQPVLQDDPPGTSLGVPSGSQWGRVDIRVCLTAGSPIHVTQEPWHLQFSDGSQADVTGLNGGDFPKPEFPQDRVVQPGQCARGGIMFPVPKGQRPRQVVYSPDSIPTPTYWDLAAK